ncbi:MAG: FAD/NAD(P)-binding protein [Bacteroidota bacterium]
MSKKSVIGIVGIGPRGLFALEQFVVNLADWRVSKPIEILLFEATGNFGNGQVYEINQLETNWINISERILLLEERLERIWNEIHLPFFPSYHQWADIDPDSLNDSEPDRYPPRSKIGTYLQQRFESLANPLIQAGILQLFEEQVKKVTLTQTGTIQLSTDRQTIGNIDELLLTIGHQDTQLSEQLSAWKQHETKQGGIRVFEAPYPIRDFWESKALTPKRTIGIRGFGLAMIDVARGIASRFGRFEITDSATQQYRYHPQEEGVPLLVPFSLDGLPPAPKPLNAELDRWYEPSQAHLLTFEQHIGDSSVQRNANSPRFLFEAIAPIAANLYCQLAQTYAKEGDTKELIESVILDWLQDEQFEHRLLLSPTQPTRQMMEAFVGMATGYKPISLDFCVGQVWRHCQPSMYEQLSFNECKDEVFVKIIQVDERMKRYAYGPPVASIQQMIALVSAEVMTLDVVCDPSITLSPSGWHLRSEQSAIEVDTMINSVLDSPQIKAVRTPIIQHLLSDQIIEAVHDDLGVITNSAGYLIPKDQQTSAPIALLGRLAKGTIMGVDAILECFGDRPKVWASEAVRRCI